MSTDPNKAAARAVDMIDKWKNESANIAENGFRTVVSRCFEALKSMNGTDIVDIEFHVCSMRSAREIARSFDKNIETNIYRQFYYGLSESIEKTMETLIEKLKESEKEGLLPTQRPTPMMNIHNLIVPPAHGAVFPSTMSSSPLMNNFGTPPSHPTGVSASTPRSKANAIRTLNCTRCPATNFHISGLVNHLRDAHKTTPGNEKIGFQCTCGFVAFSYKKVWEHTNKNKIISLLLKMTDVKKYFDLLQSILNKAEIRELEILHEKSTFIQMCFRILEHKSIEKIGVFSVNVEFAAWVDFVQKIEESPPGKLKA
ncbi:hypothetical protein PRIPAC_73988 [Pristionchus pacificus]|uniref:Uncharacterized protein n=1 Tax=Pristionchus pacificus TaxID=54126 RepID=A0A2A6C6U7_PRIPA|nr:hypothetical protein PRIPAC_73988 [Pristionchus pacificus]|eukprot:PDM73836.1 hypothetical protein PRIPAC_41192 [Pristionchus pacificus]